MKKNSNNYKGTTAIGKYTEVIKCPELGESMVTRRWISADSPTVNLKI